MISIDQYQESFQKALEHLAQELAGIRTGRATPSLVENLMVDYYGTKTPLQHMASISTLDSRTLSIQPWDKAALKEIEKAIGASSLGITPVNDGTTLKLPLPALTEERRKELVKVVHQKSEEAKIRIRTVREDAWKEIKAEETAGVITEDDLFRLQKELQETVAQFNEQVKTFGTKKEQEIMTV